MLSRRSQTLRIETGEKIHNLFCRLGWIMSIDHVDQFVNLISCWILEQRGSRLEPL
jgi:hypothetical protein